MKFIVTAALSLVLLGCIAPQSKPERWYRDNTSPQQFDADKSQCLFQTETMGGGSRTGFGDLFHLCMQGKGYISGG